jgi:hypothetical protein
MTRRHLIGLVAVAAVAATTVAHASAPGVVVESARTAAESVRDGVLTIARTTQAFVFGGAPAAQDAWYDNVEAMRERARRNADRVRAEADAGVASSPRYREDYDYDDDARRERYRYDDREYRENDYGHSDEPLPPVVPDDTR